MILRFVLVYMALFSGYISPFINTARASHCDPQEYACYYGNTGNRHDCLKIGERCSFRASSQTAQSPANENSGLFSGWMNSFMNIVTSVLGAPETPAAAETALQPRIRPTAPALAIMPEYAMPETPAGQSDGHWVCEPNAPALGNNDASNRSTDGHAAGGLAGSCIAPRCVLWNAAAQRFQACMATNQPIYDAAIKDINQRAKQFDPYTQKYKFNAPGSIYNGLQAMVSIDIICQDTANALIASACADYKQQPDFKKFRSLMQERDDAGAITQACWDADPYDTQKCLQEDPPPGSCPLGGA